MIHIDKKEMKIVEVFLEQGELQSSAVHEKLLKKGEDVSLVTVKRALSQMVKRGVLVAKGSGRSTSYLLSTLGRVFADVDASSYISIEPDKRYGLHSYNFELFAALQSEIFANNELQSLDVATAEYTKKTVDVPPAIHQRELERLVIELSWKSSKIEGNTYTLLDTENLLLKNISAAGKTKEETQMILNHKDAFYFVYEHRALFKNLTKKNVEEVHRLLIKDMNVGFGLRKNAVGISGSVYKPLDNIYQIEEALEELIGAVERMKSPYAKSCTALLGISYIQPFEDGNKRTSRLIANALLMAYECAPLSYRSVDEKEYREATLVFYELNSILPFKKIFIEQYDFAARNHALK